MKRIHIGIKVDDIESSIGFYSRLFGAGPTLRRTDYAKWMLDDPRVNFSIDTHGDEAAGSAHFGIQLDSPEALEAMRRHIDEAGLPRRDQNDLVCGYQHQHKSWVSDPQGAMWEVFFTTGFDESDAYVCPDFPETENS